MQKLWKQFFSIWRVAKPLHKGIGIGLFVMLIFYLTIRPNNQEDREFSIEVREEANSSQKGFELFDTNTWIKGDKELQVLEMRALKGQLEKDIAEFDPIKSASVILDMAPPKSFGSQAYKTKVSVILTLKPQSHLPTTVVWAITNHLAGAVHGLEPNQIAISDTSGKLYKVLGSNGEEGLINPKALALENYIEEKVRALLAPLGDRYTCVVQATKGSGFIAVALDPSNKEFASQIEQQLEALAASFDIPIKTNLSLLPFESSSVVAMKRGYLGLMMTAFFVAASLFALYPLLRRYRKKREEDSLFRVMTRVDINKLGESIRGENPRTIAFMLSYLEPSRAEQLIASFPEDLQEEVLIHLSELEYDNH